MRFGVNVLNFGPGATPEAFARWARLAQELGYHFLMISDHVAVTPEVQAQYPVPFYDPFMVLGWLAAVTRNVELGTTVTILPYRHPLQTARITANLDRLSGGRFIFGVGVGWAEQEFEALGVPFHRRGAIANEYLAAIKLCWTNEKASFQGQFVSFENVYTGPRPQRSPHPPVWVGGSSDAALRRAVRFGDAWHPIQKPIEWLRDTGLPRLRQFAEAERKPVPRFCPRIKLSLDGEESLAQLRRDLEDLASMGAEYVLFDTYSGTPALDFENDWRMLDTLAARVLDLKRGCLR